MSKLGIARLRSPRRHCGILCLKTLKNVGHSTFKARLFIDSLSSRVPALIYLSYYVLTYLYIYLLIITSCTLLTLLSSNYDNYFSIFNYCTYLYFINVNSYNFN